MIYYNEFNLESAAMLKQMMLDGIIPMGDIDTRSIKEVKSNELEKYKQCHFFAGIGGWAIALRMAGINESANIWTGSCPCQPFSSAGKQRGKEDDRHLWPAWFGLIKECKPTTIFGEQVASAITHGWLDDVYQGLESEGYAVGSAVLPACSVGTPHKRYRLWFVGHAEHNGRFANAEHRGHEQAIQDHQEGTDSAIEFKGTGLSSDVADNNLRERLSGYQDETVKQNGQARQVNFGHSDGRAKNKWEGVWVNCPDGKQRLIEPEIPLLVDGFSNRRPILYGLGNAIVPQVAAEFIKAAMYQQTIHGT